MPVIVSPPRFVLFGLAHLLTLLVCAGAAVALALWVRKGPGVGRAVRGGLIVVLLGASGGYIAAVARTGRLDLWDIVPLHLCDFLILVAIYALVTFSPRATELLYFWAGTGTFLAMVTPDLREGFPDWRFCVYFLLHGGVVAAAVVLVFGFGLRPRPGAPGRAFLFTNLYAAAVYLVDVAFDKNFLYLRGKPYAPTLLDWFGPWPVYLLVAEGVALALFFLLYVPFASARRPVTS